MGLVQGPCEIGMGTWGTLPKGGEHWLRRSATGCAGAIKGGGQDNLLPILEGYRAEGPKSGGHKKPCPPYGIPGDRVPGDQSTPVSAGREV